MASHSGLDYSAEQDTVPAVPGTWIYERLSPERVKWFYLRPPLSLRGKKECAETAVQSDATSNTCHACKHAESSVYQAGYLPLNKVTCCSWVENRIAGHCDWMQLRWLICNFFLIQFSVGCFSDANSLNSSEHIHCLILQTSMVKMCCIVLIYGDSAQQTAIGLKHCTGKLFPSI